MNYPFVNLRPFHAEIRAEIDAAIRAVLDREYYISGPECAAFEQEFADYCGAGHAIGVSNGLDALILILKALEIGRGDEVLLPANTFIATALAVSEVGARPVLVDVDPITFNIDPKLAAKKITQRTKALIGVHLYGQLCDVDALTDFCQAEKIHFIEDAAQAHGAEHRGRRAGSWGIAAGFSFYPAKNLGALGDGGAVTTNDVEFARKLRLLRNYGSEKKYVHLVKGVNNRLDEIHAAVLRVKLRRLDADNLVRQQMAAVYDRELNECKKLALPKIPEERTSHVWHLYVARTGIRDEVQNRLREAGVETLIHYPIPIHLQEAYKDLGLRAGAFEITETLSREILSLPLWIGLDATACAAQISKTLASAE